MIEIKYSYKCSVAMCDNVSVDIFESDIGWELPKLRLSNRWHALHRSDFIICDKHTIKIKTIRSEVNDEKRMD